MSVIKQYTWYKIAESKSEIMMADNSTALLSVSGKKICLVKWQGNLYGCAHKCPHASGLMHEGWIDGTGNIVCPLHRYKFSILNGRNTSGEGYFLKTYPIEEKEDGVYIGL